MWKYIWENDGVYIKGLKRYFTLMNRKILTFKTHASSKLRVRLKFILTRFFRHFVLLAISDY